MNAPLLALSLGEADAAGAVFERMFPADGDSPGAIEIGAVDYLDQALSGWLCDCVPLYRSGLAALDAACRNAHGAGFSQVSSGVQDDVLRGLEAGKLADFAGLDQCAFFAMLRIHLQEGLFADPEYGGNRNKSGWKALGHPGVWLGNSAEENLSATPVDKGGVIKCLADVRTELRDRTSPDPEFVNFDPQKSSESPRGPVDVILVGVGAAGGLIAPILAKAGLSVVGLEAGPMRSLAEYLPDELGAAYYCRQNLGPKFMSEEIRWRTSEQQPTRDPTYSLGRMMNNAGGSVIHYGAWLRRFHPHHFRFRSHILDRWGASVIPDDCTVADWPVSYDDLEPYFTKLDWEIGIAGDDHNPFLRRSKGYPLPPMRPFRSGERFGEAARSLGLHPHAVPVGMNTRPYNGYPETSYTAWSNGFGSWTGDKWHPALTSIPQALATGNFELRTQCCATRIVTNGDGRATGVEYIDKLGQTHTQRAGTVILSAYTWENLRLLFLSADTKHGDGLGNNSGQLGKHLMVKMFPHVDGFFPNDVFNRHTGPAAQGVVLDDFLHEGFDSWQEGEFLGGMTVGAENQYLPIQIAREALPCDVPSWGLPYRRHIQQWQHLAIMRAQPEALSYTTNFADIDPHVRDQSGLRMPVMRVTYDLRENERRLASYFRTQGETILRTMGATKTWAGPDFTGVGSSHDLGGARMADDPAAGVVDRHLQVHDTPGLYVFGGAVMPTCPGINPTLTLWALAYKAADELISRLRTGVEQ